jgi:hypothetical protein
VINTFIPLGTLIVFASATFAVAQAQQQSAKPQTPSQITTTVKPTTALTGCLYREDQVPGRTPNVAERAGILEDYILADVTVSDPQQQPKPAGAPASTGTAGTLPATGTMYKVENIPDDRLKTLVGKRVEVTGKIEPEGRPGAGTGGVRPDRSLGPDAISLPEIEASSIREVSGTCPAKAPLPK